MEEERRKRQEIESRLEQEWKLREEQELRWQRMEQAFLEERQRMMDAERQRYEASQQQMQTMFAYIQGLGASVNYQPPPTVTWPPPPLSQIGFAPGSLVTPVSMNGYIYLLAHIY